MRPGERSAGVRDRILLAESLSRYTKGTRKESLWCIMGCNFCMEMTDWNALLHGVRFLSLIHARKSDSRSLL